MKNVKEEGVEGIFWVLLLVCLDLAYHIYCPDSYYNPSPQETLILEEGLKCKRVDNEDN